MLLSALICLPIMVITGLPQYDMAPQTNHHLFVISPHDESTSLPENAIQVVPHQIPNVVDKDHDIHTKPLMAVPVSDAEPSNQVLKNHLGEPVIAEHIDNSNEDLMTAENFVFRPLFVYRKKMAKRKQLYGSANGTNGIRRRAGSNVNRRSGQNGGHNHNHNRQNINHNFKDYHFGYSSYYPNYYGGYNQGFPTLA